MSQVLLQDIGKRYSATVLKTNRITPDRDEEIREIVLEVDDMEFSCEVDQCFGVLTKNPFNQKDHHRLYSIADVPSKSNNKNQFKILVKRCIYIDAFSGEEVQGIASNYLCSRRVGDEITITGPYPLPFKIPEDNFANLILIGMGTGIAPFRAFIKHIYQTRKDWKGKIRLFYGTKTGLELLYLNDKDQDRFQYYDEKTFHAIHDLSPISLWMDPPVENHNIVEKAEEILDILWQSNTYIYVAGHEKVMKNLDAVFAEILGSKAKWSIRKNNLQTNGKWAEVIY